MAKIVKTRVQNKHDVEANWNLATSFIPLKGELIVYDPDATHAKPRFKFGDGIVNADGVIVGTLVKDLPFAHLTEEELKELVQTVTTVNDATLTINWKGEKVGEFSANASENRTVNIDAGEAADKDVDTSISAGSTSTNLPTSKAVADFVESKGYKTTDNDTTYDLAAAKSKSNGNVTIDLKAGGSGSGTDSVIIKGSGATTVTTDANGVITISSTDTTTQDSNDNQTVKAGNVTFDANDVVEFVAGNNIGISGSASDKTITISATDTTYTHPTTAGNKHIPSGGATGQVLKWSADGTATWGEAEGTDIQSGAVLPETGNDGDVFLQTSMAGQQYTETITVTGTGIYTLTYPIASIINTDYPDYNYPSFSVSNGALKVEGDWYSEGEVTITYVVGEGSSNTYPKQVYCDITSYGTDISSALVKGVDNGSMITLYLDYSLAADYGEESFSFGSKYADKTVLGIYALTESGITPYDTAGVSGPPQLTNFTPGQALSNGFYFCSSPTRLRENVAVIIIYYV